MSNRSMESNVNSFAIFAFSVLLAAVVSLSIRLSAQRKLLLQIREEQRALAEFRRGEAAELSQFIGSKPNPIITIEILNAVELAGKSSRVAGLIGRCAPDVLHRMVVKRTADNLRDQMTEHGVQVEVQVHGLKRPAALPG